MSSLTDRLKSLGSKLDPLIEKAGYLAGNYLPLGKVPLAKKLNYTSSDETFSPQEMERIYQEYLASADLVQGIKSSGTFKEYADKRVSDLEGLAALKMGDENSDGVKTPDGKTIADKLKIVPPNTDLSDDVKAVKVAFAKALESDDATIQARNDFEETMRATNAVIAQKPPKFKLGGIASHLQEVKAAATNAIKNQHQKEIAAVTSLFDAHSQSLTDIKTSMGLATDDDVTKFKDDTLAVLKKKHTEELDKLDKTMESEITNLHSNAQNERNRISYLAKMYETSDFMKRQIDALAKENAKNNPGQAQNVPVIALGSSKNGVPIALLKGIKVTDMPIIESVTGRKITYDKASDTFSMEMPNVGLFYYNSFNQNPENDLRSLAQAVRACGYEQITMTVEYPDQKYAMEVGRKQFEAAAKAGFNPLPTDPNDKDKKVKAITIMVNGKEVSAEELFKDNPTRLAAIRTQYQKDELTRSNNIDSDINDLSDASDFKAAVSKQRQKQQAGAGGFNPVPPQDEPEPPQLGI